MYYNVVKQEIIDWNIMGKHHDKVLAALKQRQAATGPGEKKAGSMNPRKTGFRGHKAKGPK